MSTARRARIIVNPNAGSYESAKGMLDGLDQRRDVDVVETRAQGDAARLARQAVQDRCDRVVAGGGDGTLHEVVNAIGPFSPVGVGVLPLGTGNDFARGMRIPLDAPEEALRIALESPLIEVDLIRCETTRGASLIVNAAAGGLNEAIHREVDSTVKKTLGRVAYLLSAAKQVLDPPVFSIRVHVEDQTFSGRVHAIVVANAGRLGGGLPVAPSASANDGRFDVYLLPRQSRGEIAFAGFELLLGAHESSGSVVTFATDAMIVEVAPNMRMHLDGEGVESDRFEFRVLPRALRFAASA